MWPELLEISVCSIDDFQSYCLGKRIFAGGRFVGNRCTTSPVISARVWSAADSDGDRLVGTIKDRAIYKLLMCGHRRDNSLTNAPPAQRAVNRNETAVRPWEVKVRSSDTCSKTTRCGQCLSCYIYLSSPFPVACSQYRQVAQLSQRDRAAGGG